MIVTFLRDTNMFQSHKKVCMQLLLMIQKCPIWKYQSQTGLHAKRNVFQSIQKTTQHQSVQKYDTFRLPFWFFHHLKKLFSKKGALKPQINSFLAKENLLVWIAKLSRCADLKTIIWLTVVHDGSLRLLVLSKTSWLLLIVYMKENTSSEYFLTRAVSNTLTMIKLLDLFKLFQWPIKLFIL